MWCPVLVVLFGYDPVCDGVARVEIQKALNEKVFVPCVRGLGVGQEYVLGIKGV